MKLRRKRETENKIGLDLENNDFHPTAVRMKQITKKYPGVIANDHVDFEVKVGQIHGLLGENGAGKSTLMNLLSGLSQPDEGEIYIHDQRVVFNSPKDAINLGIGMIHQHFMLAPTLTVLENVILGLPGDFLINRKKVDEEIFEISQKYGLKVDPQAKVSQLSVGEKQRVEIIKILFRGAQILILDEPTSVLAPPEAKNLFTTLKSLAKGGRSIIFITHKLDEVLFVCDKITVLKNGKVIKTVDARKTEKRKLATMMVGREIVFQVSKTSCEKGNAVLEVYNLKALNDRGLVAIKDVSFTVCQHEILGIAGVAGNGQKELAEVITGLREAKQGKILILGKDLTNKSADAIIKEGVCHIPEDRLSIGIIPDFSIADNMILENYRNPPFSNHFFMNDVIIKKRVGNLIKDYDIRTPSQKVLAVNLSGGNIQKLILARGLSRHPKLIIANNPTTGLDVGAIEYIQQKLIEERDKGAAIVLISEDLDEIISLSDRIAVIYEGNLKIVPKGAKSDHIGLMMTSKS